MARRKRPKWKITEKRTCLRVVGVMGLLSVIASLVSIAVLERARGSDTHDKIESTTRVAFGSGTSFDYRPQPVWVQGVIPSDPDAWIWLGDMAYMDKPRINCDALPWHQQCNCSSTWLHQSNHSCMAGNIEFASSRIEVQLSNPDYAQFLAFMCPGHRVKGLHPPTGSDPSVCSRQILGTYDDHDYGWEHGNKRLPQKDQMKQFFLDALGEPHGSPRRDPGHGIEWKESGFLCHLGHNSTDRGGWASVLFGGDLYELCHGCEQRQCRSGDVDVQGSSRMHRPSMFSAMTISYMVQHTLNDGKPGQVIDIYLLDERYYRDTLPCHTRKAFCEKVALADVHHPKHAWCLDFLQGGDLHNGSCCRKDEEVFYGWCLQSSNKAHALWHSLCNPESPNFGYYGSSLNQHMVTDINQAGEPGGSSFCEILGEKQRKWFEDAILHSKAPIKLVVSSSVVIGNPTKKTCEDFGTAMSEVECPCSGDDWECYKPAQLQFLNVLSHSSGCVLLLTGGLEYSDIRVLKQGAHQSLKHYGGIEFSYPLYQVMASGLTTSTERNFSCDVLRKDPLRVRDHAECNFVRAPSFGMIEVVWEKDPTVKIQIRDGMTGTVKLESSLRIGSCSQREMGRKLKSRQ